MCIALPFEKNGKHDKVGENGKHPAAEQATAAIGRQPTQYTGVPFLMNSRHLPGFRDGLYSQP